MNLQCHLLSRIAIVALLCWLAATAYVLYRSDLQAKQAARATAESLGKQLELQLLRIDAGFGLAEFPDFSLWKQTGGAPGTCIGFSPAAGVAHSLCNGTNFTKQSWPAGFELVYHRLFTPGLAITRPIAFKGRTYGALTVTPSAEMELAQAWDNVLGLSGLSAMTILSVCVLVYLSTSRALRPARRIVAGVERMEQGDLAYRLPAFELNEWQRTAEAINRLAASQQQLLAERQKLAVRLLNLQEEERRYLARELHDEFGQCLAAINAVAAGIGQTAERQCPELVEEAAHVGRISRHLMASVRELLGRLRPAELDARGLAACLNSQVSGWNARSGGKTRYQLEITGDCGLLPEPLAVTLFRLVQECLTNVAKHSAAAHVSVRLGITPESASLIVQDDGVAVSLPFADGPGIGLLGMRERVTALHGRLALAIAEPHGLVVDAWLPLRN